MPRKFNVGRQSEQLLNKELHDLLMAVKYINNGAKEPNKDMQTDIPYGSLWNDNSYGKNILKAYNQNKGWDPVFKGYYHPANLIQKPSTPVHGQVWIDSSKNDLIHYYDENTNSWIAARALEANKNDVGVSGFDNFVYINPLIASIKENGYNTYLIPSETEGRMFDGNSYIHPSSSDYTKLSDVTIKFKDKILNDTESWVHVNASRLNNCVKRLIKVNKDMNTNKAYEIDINAFNTEFYGVNNTTKICELLRLDKDYVITDVGIRLLSNAFKYEYVYSISYSFATSNYPGKLLRQSKIVGTEDEIFVGSYSKRPLVFLDGLYLEQNFYNYDIQEGLVTIVNDDITNRMDMMSVIFNDISSEANKPYEYTINQSNLNGVDAVIGPLTANTQSFKKCLAFVSGVAGVDNRILTPSEIIINGTNAVIKNIGPIGSGDSFKVMLVDVNSMFLDSGIIGKDNAINSNKITGEDDYIVFVDGLMMSPREFKISKGSIRIHGLKEGQQFILLKADNKESAITFDNIVASHTIRIIDTNESVTYNDCDNAVVFVDNGVLVDEASVVKGQQPTKGISGQIIKTRRVLEDNTTIIGYKIWDYSTYTWLDILDVNEVSKIDSLISYFSTKGSISILNNSFVGKPLTYYAYTYNNHIDEPLLVGHRSTTIDSNLSPNKLRREFKTDLDHTFRHNMGSLSTYLNKLRVVNEESATAIGEFSIDNYDGPNNNSINVFDNGSLMYVLERPEASELMSCSRQLLTARDRDEMYVNGYRTNIRLSPGVVNVYLNGVRLKRTDFTIIGENTLMLLDDCVGGQEHCLINDESSLKRFAIKKKGTQIQYIDCLKSDELIVEVREDYRLKTLTLPVRYPGQFVFSVGDDGLNETMLNTKDLVMIYINGVLYDGEYTISKEANCIILEDPELQNILGIDKMEKYFLENPIAYAQYQDEYGKYYPKKVYDEITFEWR